MFLEQHRDDVTNGPDLDAKREEAIKPIGDAFKYLSKKIEPVATL
jgi:hypothetical protein